VLSPFGVLVVLVRKAPKPRNTHGQTYKPRITVNHQVGEGEPPPSALAEARHHTARDPVIWSAAHRPDHRIPIGSKREGAVDHLSNAGALDRRIVPKCDLEARCDA